MKEKDDTGLPILRYSGSTRILGGKYDSKVQVSGHNKIEGNLECQAFTCSGWVTCEGNLVVHGMVRMSGRFKGQANVLIEGDVAISGAVSIKGNMIVLGYLHNSGIFTVNGDVRARQLNLGGIPRIRGQVYYVDNIKAGNLSRLRAGPIRIQAEDLNKSQIPVNETLQEQPQPGPTLTIAPPGKFCPFCGTELDEKGTFCDACGNKI